MKLSSIYNKLNELLKHLFKPFPILLGITVSVIEINDYLTPDPVERVLAQIEKSQEAINELKMVDIPDSLQTETIKEARLLQQRLIGYAKIVNSCDVIRSDDKLYLSAQQSQIINAVNASQCASEELFKFIRTLSLTHLNEFHACSMYIANGDLMDENMSKLIEKTGSALKHAESDEESLKCLKNFIASEEMGKWINSNKDFICSGFEFLNVVQLSIVYDLKMKFNPVAK